MITLINDCNTMYRVDFPKCAYVWAVNFFGFANAHSLTYNSLMIQSLIFQKLMGMARRRGGCVCARGRARGGEGGVALCPRGMV